ncbi:GNAT family N-acetyltransferase [Bizionia paragorgiae]|uniref:GNAT family N-acetyltransferase n=1 Tax=Bizionia paragorgiae TaxID=283786 RepID=UPI003A95B97C
MKKEIIYKTNQKLNIDDIVELFYNSGYLPLKDMSNVERIERMFNNTTLVVSAWHGETLIGISRSLCDFSYACYLSDICVHKEYRKFNIGRKLIEITKEKAGNECKLILHSNTEAIDFYKKIGMKRISDTFIIQRDY